MLIIRITDRVRWIDIHGPAGEYRRIPRDEFPEPGQSRLLKVDGRHIGLMRGVVRKYRHEGEDIDQRYVGFEADRAWRVARSNAVNDQPKGVA